MLRQRIIEDEALEKPFNKEQFKRLLSYMAPYKKQLAIAVILMIVASVCGLLGPLLLQIGIDDYMMQGDYKGLMIITLVFLGVNFASMVCVRSRVRIMVVVGEKIIFRLRQDLFNHIQGLSFTFYDNRPAGKILVRIINDVNSLSDLLTSGIINVITDAFTLVVTLLFMFYIHSKLALISLTTIPLMGLVIALLKRKIRVRWQTVRKKSSNMNAYLHESLAGMRVTQVYGREPETREIYQQLSGDIHNSWMDAVRINNLFWPSIEWIAAIGTILVYWFGIKFLDQGTVTVGILVAFVGYVWRFWQPLNSLCNFYNSLLMAMASTERIFELLDVQPDVTDREDAIEMPSIDGRVRFEHVTFHYEPEKPVLSDINFVVEPGQTVALVGPTGAGKTTIVNLISRFYEPVEGRVLIDDIDVCSATLHSLRSQMGVMLQDPFIFSGTIMDNIRYGRLDATDEEVIEAAKAVYAHEFIRDMEDGYYTEVKERGSRLSQGQKQLLSFARALLADPKILILDEATSSIDTHTEMLIQKALKELLKGRTSFVIAHRLSTIRNADNIMVIDANRIIECGNHEALMKKRGEYYNLYEAQYRFLQAI
jgi:ATP-binding cassette subfamily B multidrug efflux pump